VSEPKKKAAPPERKRAVSVEEFARRAMMGMSQNQPPETAARKTDDPQEPDPPWPEGHGTFRLTACPRCGKKAWIRIRLKGLKWERGRCPECKKLVKLRVRPKTVMVSGRVGNK
jgi:hypothetical protein